MKFKNITLLALVLITMFISYRCIEEVKNPCNDATDITLTLKGDFKTICEGIEETAPAVGAQILILQRLIEDGTVDTLILSGLNADGELVASIPNSSCGISNIKFIATYNSFVFTDSIDFMCCDTTVYLSFKKNCAEIVETQISCESIDTIISLQLANQYQGCLQLGSDRSEIRWNSISLNSKENITIDMNPVINLNGKYNANLSIDPDNKGFVTFKPESQNLSIVFFVETTEVGVFNSQLILPTTCTDSLGGKHTGKITINLNAEVCDNACSCPFSGAQTAQVNVDKSSLGVLVKTSQTYANEAVLEITNSMLDDGCYMVVNAVERLNSSAPINSILPGNEVIHDWVITSTQNLQEHLVPGSFFGISAMFSPDLSGISADTFEVQVQVFNRVDEIKDNCSFLVSFVGLGCENIQPVITIQNLLPSELLRGTDNSVIKPLKYGDIVPMRPDTLIKQSMTGYLGTLCKTLTSRAEKVAYKVSLPNIPNIVSCSGIKVSLRIEDDGQPGDRSFFELDKYSFILNESGNSSFEILFNTPNIQQHVESGHGSTYKGKVVLEATDEMGRVVSSQIIRLEADVFESALQLSEPMSMKAFSQVSDKDTIPAYQAYKIDSYNSLYQYYGKIDNLSPVLGHVNVADNPKNPATDHSFFFEVDEPNNKTLRQNPKLYLVETIFNNYAYITSTPVARYNSNDAFRKDLPKLVELVFKQGDFSAQGTAPATTFTFSNSKEIMWTPSKSARDLSGAGKGINLTQGDLYILWDANGTYSGFTFGGINYGNYCSVAFLYIDGVSNGSGTNHNIGNVSFQVAYPLNLIKQ